MTLQGPTPVAFTLQGPPSDEEEKQKDIIDEELALKWDLFQINEVKESEKQQARIVWGSPDHPEQLALRNERMCFIGRWVSWSLLPKALLVDVSGWALPPNPVPSTSRDELSYHLAKAYLLERLSSPLDLPRGGTLLALEQPHCIYPTRIDYDYT